MPPAVVRRAEESVRPRLTRQSHPTRGARGPAYPPRRGRRPEDRAMGKKVGALGNRSIAPSWSTTSPTACAASAPLPPEPLCGRASACTCAGRPPPEAARRPVPSLGKFATPMLAVRIFSLNRSWQVCATTSWNRSAAFSRVHRTGARQQHHELVSAHARHVIVLAALRLESRRHRLQHLVPVQVPEAVVDLLESVQIRHQHRQRLHCCAWRAKSPSPVAGTATAHWAELVRKSVVAELSTCRNRSAFSIEIPILALIPSRIRRWSLVNASRSR